MVRPNTAGRSPLFDPVEYLRFVLVQVLLCTLFPRRARTKDQTTADAIEIEMVERRARQSEALPPGKQEKDEPGSAAQFDKLVERFQGLKRNGLGGGGWETIHEDKDTGLCVSQAGKGRVRVEAVLPTTAVLCADYLSRTGEREDWDELCARQECVDGCREASSLVYYRSQPVWPLAGRDCHLAMQRRTLEDGSILIVGESRNAPAVDGIVRADVRLVGTLLVPTRRARGSLAGECRMTCIIDCDLKGYIPPTIMRSVLAKTLPSIVAKLCARLRALPATDGQRAGAPQSAPAGSGEQGESAFIFASLARINDRLDAIEKKIDARAHETAGSAGTLWALLRWSPLVLTGSFALYIYFRNNRSAALLNI